MSQTFHAQGIEIFGGEIEFGVFKAEQFSFATIMVEIVDVPEFFFNRVVHAHTRSSYLGRSVQISRSGLGNGGIDTRATGLSGRLVGRSKRSCSQRRNPVQVE